MRQARNAVQKSGGDQTGGRRKGDLCRGNHHPDWSAFWMPSGCLLDAFWMPVGCLLDACWMDGRMRHETTPTVALTAIHATVVLPLSPSLSLSLPLSLSPSLSLSRWWWWFSPTSSQRTRIDQSSSIAWSSRSDSHVLAGRQGARERACGNARFGAEIVTRDVDFSRGKGGNSP